MGNVLHRADLVCADPPIADLCDRKACGCFYKYMPPWNGGHLSVYDLTINPQEVGNKAFSDAQVSQGYSFQTRLSAFKYSSSGGYTLEYLPNTERWELTLPDSTVLTSADDNPYGMWNYASLADAIDNDDVLIMTYGNVGSSYYPDIFTYVPNSPQIYGDTRNFILWPDGSIRGNTWLATSRDPDPVNWLDANGWDGPFPNPNPNGPDYRIYHSHSYEYETLQGTHYLRYRVAECCYNLQSSNPDVFAEESCVQRTVEETSKGEIIVCYRRDGPDFQVFADPTGNYTPPPELQAGDPNDYADEDPWYFLDTINEN